MKNGSDVIFSSDIAKKVLASFMNEVYYLSVSGSSDGFSGPVLILRRSGFEKRQDRNG